MGAKSDPSPDVPVDEPEFDRSFLSGAVVAVFGAEGPEVSEGTDMGGVYVPSLAISPPPDPIAEAERAPGIPLDTIPADPMAESDGPGEITASPDGNAPASLQSFGGACPLISSGCDCECEAVGGRVVVEVFVGLLYALGAFVRGRTWRGASGEGDDWIGEERLRGMLGGGIVDVISHKQGRRGTAS
jgi:hypothetical protein